jgi:hypothetical protein
MMNTRADEVSSRTLIERIIKRRADSSYWSYWSLNGQSTSATPVDCPWTRGRYHLKYIEVLAKVYFTAPSQSLPPAGFLDSRERPNSPLLAAGGKSPREAMSDSDGAFERFISGPDSIWELTPDREN